MKNIIGAAIIAASLAVGGAFTLSPAMAANPSHQPALQHKQAKPLTDVSSQRRYHHRRYHHRHMHYRPYTYYGPRHYRPYYYRPYYARPYYYAPRPYFGFGFGFGPHYYW